MKKFLTMVAAVCMFASCDARDIEKSVNYDVEAFSAIDMIGVGEIIYKQGDTFSVKAEGDSIHLDNVTVKVKDGELVIGQKKDLKNNEGINFYITAPMLKKVTCAGVGTLKMLEAVSFDNDFCLYQEGVGSVKIEDLTCKDFDFHQEGVGAADIKVNCKNAKTVREGVGAATLVIEADTLVLSSEGVGAIKVSGHVKDYQKKKSSIISAIQDKNLVVGK